MSDVMLIILALLCGILFGIVLIALIVANDERLIHCPECKYYYAPVCTFYKWLPMVSRKGFCYHARKGRYQGKTPTIKDGGKDDRRD